MPERPIVEVYWNATCSTCRQALAHLERRGARVKFFRDLKTEPLSLAEVRALAWKVGAPERLFSRRARAYRERGLRHRDLTAQEMLALMAEEWTFIARPVIVRDDAAVAGYRPADLNSLLDRY